MNALIEIWSLLLMFGGIWGVSKVIEVYDIRDANRKRREIETRQYYARSWRQA